MADVKDITRDLSKLDSQLDDLETALEPLLTQLEERASALPLLDRAKLFSLAAYSIESLLFCTFSFLCIDHTLMQGSPSPSARCRRAKPRRVHGAEARTAVFQQD